MDSEVEKVSILFRKLPPEIRKMIWLMVIAPFRHAPPIPLHSFRTKAQRNKPLTPQQKTYKYRMNKYRRTIGTFLISKQANIEITMAFFPLQTFSISNRAGNWGRCKPTLAGFNTFIRAHKYKTPLIKRIIIHLDLSQSLSQEPSKSGVQGCAMSSETKVGVGLKNIKDFHHICEALVKHFTSLRDVEIQTWCAEISPYRYQQNPDTELIEPKENIPVEKSKNYAAVFTALKMLMNCKNLAKIKILEGGWVNIKPVVQDFVIKVPDAAKLVEYRTPDRSWIQKKPWINFDKPHMNYTLKQWKHGGKKWW